VETPLTPTTGPLVRLEQALSRLEAAYERRNDPDAGPGSTATPLLETLQILEEIGYTKRDIMYSLNVEGLTVDRWLDGKDMKPNSLGAYRSFIREIIRGRPQRPINVSDTGFVTWRYVFEDRQARANRIWYIAASEFLVFRSLSVKEVLKNLFSKQRQKDEADLKKKHSPVLVYLYHTDSAAESSLRQWHHDLLEIIEGGEPLEGTIIGISDEKNDLPWFLPGVRAVMLENGSAEESSVELEGYLLVPLPDAQTSSLLQALNTPEKRILDVENPQLPWLSVHREVTEQWYSKCKYRYTKLIEAAVKDQEGNGRDFAVYYSKA
jgi:hypothetical protein